MPSNTPNKGFYLPDTLEDGWDDNKNKDWQILDQIVQNIPNDGDLTSAIDEQELTNVFGQSLSPTSDVSFASVDTERLFSNNAVLAYWYDDDINQRVYRGYPTIQEAIDALPLQDNEYNVGERTAGGIEIWSKEGDNPYDGQVIINKKGVYEGKGLWTELSHSVAGEPTVVVDESGTTKADDVYLRDLWVEHRGGDVAIHSTIEEIHLQDLNIEDAGETSILIEGDRSTASGIENKGGGFRLKTSNRGHYSQILSNDELERGIPSAITLVDSNQNTFMNCHGWVRGGSIGVKIFRSDENVFVGSAGVAPKAAAGVKAGTGIELSTTAEHNVIYALVRDSTTGISFGDSLDNVVWAQFYNCDTNIDWGTGSRNIVNGRSVNAGDPRSTGAWNTHAARAATLNVRVEDNTTTPFTPYKAVGDGAGGYQFVQDDYTA